MVTCWSLTYMTRRPMQLLDISDSRSLIAAKTYLSQGHMQQSDISRSWPHAPARYIWVRVTWSFNTYLPRGHMQLPHIYLTQGQLQLPDISDSGSHAAARHIWVRVACSCQTYLSQCHMQQSDISESGSRAAVKYLTHGLVTANSTRRRGWVITTPGLEWIVIILNETRTNWPNSAMEKKKIGNSLIFVTILK